MDREATLKLEYMKGEGRLHGKLGYERISQMS